MSEPHEEPKLSISGDPGIIDVPMPEVARMRVAVWRHQLEGLRNTCRGIKRRARALPFQMTAGWSALTAAAYSAVGWFVSRNSEPKPQHNVFLMYQFGVLLGGLTALFLLAWGYSRRRDFKDDIDELVEEIHRIDYASKVLPE